MNECKRIIASLAGSELLLFASLGGYCRLASAQRAKVLLATNRLKTEWIPAGSKEQRRSRPVKVMAA